MQKGEHYLRMCMNPYWSNNNFPGNCFSSPPLVKHWGQKQVDVSKLLHRYCSVYYFITVYDCRTLIQPDYNHNNVILVSRHHELRMKYQSDRNFLAITNGFKASKVLWAAAVFRLLYVLRQLNHFPPPPFLYSVNSGSRFDVSFSPSFVFLCSLISPIQLITEKSAENKETNLFIGFPFRYENRQQLTSKTRLYSDEVSKSSESGKEENVIAAQPFLDTVFLQDSNFLTHPFSHSSSPSLFPLCSQVAFGISGSLEKSPSAIYPTSSLKKAETGHILLYELRGAKKAGKSILLENRSWPYHCCISSWLSSKKHKMSYRLPIKSIFCWPGGDSEEVIEVL